MVYILMRSRAAAEVADDQDPEREKRKIIWSSIYWRARVIKKTESIYKILIAYNITNLLLVYCVSFRYYTPINIYMYKDIVDGCRLPVNVIILYSNNKTSNGCNVANLLIHNAQNRELSSFIRLTRYETQNIHNNNTIRSIGDLARVDASIIRFYRKLFLSRFFFSDRLQTTSRFILISSNHTDGHGW